MQMLILSYTSHSFLGWESFKFFQYIFYNVSNNFTVPSVPYPSSKKHPHTLSKPKVLAINVTIFHYHQCNHYIKKDNDCCKKGKFYEFSKPVVESKVICVSCNWLFVVWISASFILEAMCMWLACPYPLPNVALNHLANISCRLFVKLMLGNVIEYA